MAARNPLRQASLRVRLSELPVDRADSLGVVGLRCRLSLHVERMSGGVKAVIPFVVDSGASYPMMSLALAQLHRLAIPSSESEVVLPLRTGAGIAPTRVRPGRIRAWWTADQSGYPFDWPMLFRVDAPDQVPPVLGLGGILKTCQWTFNGGYTPASPHGYLTLDDIR